MSLPGRAVPRARDPKILSSANPVPVADLGQRGLVDVNVRGDPHELKVIVRSASRAGYWPVPRLPGFFGAVRPPRPVGARGSRQLTRKALDLGEGHRHLTASLARKMLAHSSRVPFPIRMPLTDPIFPEAGIAGTSPHGGQARDPLRSGTASQVREVYWRIPHLDHFNPRPAATHQSHSPAADTWWCSGLSGIRSARPRPPAAPGGALPMLGVPLPAGAGPAIGRSACRGPGTGSGLLAWTPLAARSGSTTGACTACPGQRCGQDCSRTAAAAARPCREPGRAGAKGCPIVSQVEIEIPGSQVLRQLPGCGPDLLSRMHPISHRAER